MNITNVNKMKNGNQVINHRQIIVDRQEHLNVW